MKNKDDDGVKVDKQGRILDKLGRPLRQRVRNQAPFHGQDGKPHPRAGKLKRRQAGWNSKLGKQPGSLRK